jgi:Protein of unknown function (DUF3467)
MAEDTSRPTVGAKQLKLELVKDPGGILRIYSNNFSIGQTVFDLRLVFGELTDLTEEKIVVTQRVQVTLSWLEAKALAESLMVYIKHYEQSYGTIKTEFTPMQNPTLPEIPKIVQPTDKS